MKEEIHVPDYLMLNVKKATSRLRNTWSRDKWDPRWDLLQTMKKILCTKCCNCDRFGRMERMWYGPACKKCLREEL